MLSTWKWAWQEYLSVQCSLKSRYRHLETQRNDLQREYLLFRLHSSALTALCFTTLQYLTPPEVLGLCAQLDSAAETRDAAVKEREEILTPSYASACSFAVEAQAWHCTIVRGVA